MSSATGVRLTLKFNFNQEIRACGWSESYDLGFASLASAVAASANIAQFILDRCFCLGMGPILVEAVLSAFVQPVTPGAAPARRATISFPVPNPPAAGNAYNKALSKDDTYDADYSTTVLFLSAQTNLSDPVVYRRTFWLAGLPDCADLTSQLRLTDTPTQQAVTKFSGDLNNSNTTLGGKCTVSVRSIDRSAGNPIKPITGWAAGPPVVFTLPAHGFVVGQPVIAEGMTVEPGGTALRGRYLVSVVVDVNTLQLGGVTSIGVAVKPGGLRAAIITFTPIQVVFTEGMTKRNKGRPSGLSVGRRRRPRTARA